MAWIYTRSGKLSYHTFEPIYPDGAYIAHSGVVIAQNNSLGVSTLYQLVAVLNEKGLVLTKDQIIDFYYDVSWGQSAKRFNSLMNEDLLDYRTDRQRDWFKSLFGPTQ